MTNPDLFTALCKAQAEFPAIERSKTVQVKTKTGGTYSFDYAPLDAIFAAVRPVLAANGLAVSQLLTESANGTPALETVLTHSAGGSLRGTVPLPATNGMSAQEFGSLVTYYRRYGLVAALGIATEDDDDGNHASGNTAKGKARTSATPTKAAGGASNPPIPPPAAADDPEAEQIPFGEPAPHEEFNEPEPQSVHTDNLLTGKQNKMLGSLVTKLTGEGKTNVESVRAYMDANYGKTSRASLTKKEASETIEWLLEMEKA